MLPSGHGWFPPARDLSESVPLAPSALSLSLSLSIATFVLMVIVVPVIQGLTGAWAYSTFGFIAAAVMLIPYLIFVFGARLRCRSKYSPMTSSSMMMAKQTNGGEEGGMMGHEKR